MSWIKSPSSMYISFNLLPPPLPFADVGEPAFATGLAVCMPISQRSCINMVERRLPIVLEEHQYVVYLFLLEEQH